MSKYSGKPTVVNRPNTELYSKLNDIDALRQRFEEIPDDLKAQAGQIRFEPDRLIIVTPQVGEIGFVVKDRKEPERVVFAAEKSPVPLDLVIDLKATGENATEVTTSIEIDLPMMLRPLVGPQMQKAADKLGELIGQLNS
ncbi:MAG: SRPBCC family protein [Muribaculaceae bacterium]|nr:SRPBCC family protein [Muribaculaceae bacterium]